MWGFRSRRVPERLAALSRDSAISANIGDWPETTQPVQPSAGAHARRARRVFPWVATVALVWSLAGCSSPSDSSGPSDTATVSVTTTQTVRSTSSPEASKATPGRSTSQDGNSSQILRAPTQGAKYFKTPSGNITCFLLSYDVRSVDCVVQEQDFADPPRPADCNLDWAPQFTLGGASSYGACRGDVDGTPTDTVLGYGGKAVDGPITCRSEVSGLSCTNDKTSHGFTISRATYRLY